MNRNAGLRHGLFSVCLPLHFVLRRRQAHITHRAVPEAGAPVRRGSWGASTPCPSVPREHEKMWVKTMTVRKDLKPQMNDHERR